MRAERLHDSTRLAEDPATRFTAIAVVFLGRIAGIKRRPLLQSYITLIILPACTVWFRYLRDGSTQDILSRH